MNLWNCPQGSEDWLQLRVGKITASRYKDARDRLKPAKGETIGKPSNKCTAYAAQVAVERIAQRAIDKVFQNWQMREGQEQEPHARTAYDVETGNIVQEVGAITTDDDLFLYSPDGLIGDDGLLEIKTLLSADVICKVIGDGDLSAYMDQCLGGLWLTGRQWIDLVLWAPALEPIGRQLTIHRITRDENAIEALEEDLVAFAGMVRDSEAKLRGSPQEMGEALAAAEEAQEQPAAAPAALSAHDRINEEGARRLLAEAERVAALPSATAAAARVLTSDLTDEHYRRAVQIVRENNRASISLVQRHLMIGYNAAATLLERMEKEGVVSHQDANGARNVIHTADNVHPMPTKAPAAAQTPPSLRLGQICERLGFTVTADFLASLGFPVVATDKSAKLWHEHQFFAICAAIAQHVVAVANGQKEAA